MINPDSIIFFANLAAQLIFTGLMIWIISRRFPGRLRLYRFVAPAPVPIFFCGMALVGLEAWAAHQHSVDSSVYAGILVRMALSYFVLWLVGVLWASMIARWTRR